MGAPQMISESKKQVANLKIITVMHCLVHIRRVHGKAFTLWSACKRRLAAKSHLTAIFTAFCCQLTTVAAWFMLKLLHQDYLSLITALLLQNNLNTIKEKNITSSSSLILSIAQLNYPWGGIGQGHESAGGTFLCHIPSLEGSVSLEDRRLWSRTRGEAGELGMICLVTGGQYFVLTDGRRHLISEMREKISRAA